MLKELVMIKKNEMKSTEKTDAFIERFYSTMNNLETGLLSLCLSFFGLE